MNARLGRGFAFPLVPEGDFPLIEGSDVVVQALYTMLSTEPGTPGSPLVGNLAPELAGSTLAGAEFDIDDEGEIYSDQFVTIR